MRVRRWRFLCLASVALVLAGCGSGRSDRAPGLRLGASGPPVVRVEPGARSAVLMRLDVRGIAPPRRPLVFRARVAFVDPAPAPLARPRLAFDRDGNGAFDPATDEFLAVLEAGPRGHTIRGVVAHAPPPGGRETWLLLADVRPAATAMRLQVVVEPGDFGSSSVAGPRVVVEPRLLASTMLLSGGGADGALRLSTGLRPARILIGGNPVTGLREEAPGVFSFLLPPSPPGPLEVLVVDADGAVLARFREAGFCNGGRGPARFRDRSLQRLPRDHAFSQDAEVADLNGDGAPDLLVPSYSGQRDRLYLNDGFGKFRDVSATHMPDVKADSVHLEPVDIDGDGDVDVAVAVEGGRNRLYENDGTGKLTDVTEQPGRMPADQDYSEDLRAGDVDGDGDLDLVAANLVDPDDTRRGGQLRLYLNDGHGRFVDATQGRLPLVATRSYDVSLRDLDGDGDLDLFAAGYGEPSRLYRNDGRGRFADVSAALPQNRDFHTCAVVGDVDGDHDLDIVVGSFVGQSRLYLNQGALRFTDGTAGLPQQEMSTYDVALADLDGDRDLDLLFANTANPSVLALNDGHGRFTVASKGEFVTPDDNAYDVQVLDADGDGALDVLITAWGDRQDTLYLARTGTPPNGPELKRVEPNWGPPSGGNWVTLRGSGFAKGASVTFDGRPLTEVTVPDAETIRGRVPPGPPGPVDLTLAVPNAEPVTLSGVYGYEPPPPGAFEDVTAATLGSEPRASTAVAAGDLNADGLPDLVFADQGRGARVRLNAPGGRMRAVPFGPLSVSANHVALADLDRDGKPDLVLVDAGAAPWLFAGRGDGTFARPRRLAAPRSGAEEVAVADLDGDGDLDLVFAGAGRETVFRNDGNWVFRQLAEPGVRADPSRGLALGDVDGDGDADLIVVNFIARARLYLNDGRGRFTEAVNALPHNDGDQSFGVALADVDLDGDLDAAIANGGAQVNRLLLNDGRGRFVEAPAGVFRAALGGGAHVVFADVDGNGSPDLFSAHFWGSNHLYFASGGRLAERPGVLPNTPGGFAGATFADLDKDGDPDLVLAAFWGGSRVLRNPRRR